MTKHEKKSDTKTDTKTDLTIRKGIEAVEDEEYLLGLSLLTEAYSGSVDKRATDGLSYYGLCLALVEKRIKDAIELCKKAIELQFYNPNHYRNLARVYIAGRNKKKAIESLDQGLKVHPEDESLRELRTSLGVRSRPAVPFLPRSSSVNRTLGQALRKKKGS